MSLVRCGRVSHISSVTNGTGWVTGGFYSRRVRFYLTDVHQMLFLPPVSQRELN